MDAMVRTRKVGGSLIVTIPNETVKELNLKVNELVEIDVHRPKKSFFGALKNLSEFTEADRLDER